MWGWGVLWVRASTILSLELGPLGVGVVEDSLGLLQLGSVLGRLVLHAARDLLHAHLGGVKDEAEGRWPCWS